MPIDNLSKITSRSGINTTILLEAGNANVTGIVTAAGFVGPFTGGGDIAAGIITGTGLKISGISTLTGAVFINRTSALGNAKLSITKEASQEGIGVQLNISSGITTSLVAFNSSGTQIFDLAHDTDSTPDLIFKLKHPSVGFPVERVRIASNGNVGISSNNSTPEALLDIKNVGSSVLPFKAYRNDVGDTPIVHLLAYNNTLGTVDKLVVTSRGRVGVNTDNPQREIHIKPDSSTASAAPAYVRIESHGSDQSAELELYHTRGNGSDKWPSAVASADGALTLKVANGNNGAPAEKVRITSDGKVGINSTSPSNTLVVREQTDNNSSLQLFRESTGGDISSVIWATNSGNQASINYRGGGGSVGMQFYTGGTGSSNLRAIIDTSGHVGIGTNAPIAPRFSSTVSGLLHLRGTKPSLYISEQDNHDPDGKERAIFAGLSGGSAFIGSNGDDGLQFLTGNGSTQAAVQLTEDKYAHFGNTGHGTNKVGGQAVTGNDFDAYFKLLSNTANSWSMQIRNDTNTGSNGMFLRAGNDNTSTYTLYATGTNEHYPSFVVRGDGNVGIGSSSPAERLQIFGNAEFNAYDNSNGQQGYYSPKGLIIGNAFDNGVGNACTDDRNGIIWQERGLDLDIGVNNQFNTKFNYQGRVGIAHSAPNARLHIGALGTGSAVGDATNPAFQIGNTTNYRFAIHTTSEGAIIANKNGDDGIQIHTKLGNTGNSGIGEAQRFHSRGYRESRNYNYGPWAFTNNTTKTTITVGDPGDNKFTTIKLILTLRDVSYRQGLWQGEFTIFASNATGGPGVDYKLKKIWDQEGSSNWSGATVSVSITSSGALQFTADNGHDDANGNAYIHILDVIGDIDGSTVASISN